MSIKSKLLMAFSAVIAVAWMCVGVLVSHMRDGQLRLAEQSHEVHRMVATDVVQVSNWLTDISATHGTAVRIKEVSNGTSEIDRATQELAMSLDVVHGSTQKLRSASISMSAAVATFSLTSAGRQEVEAEQLAQTV